MMLLPPWQVVLTLAAGAFLLRHKWQFARGILAAWSESLSECSFCLGVHLGWLSWGVAAATGHMGHRLQWDHLLSVVVWTGCSGAASLLLEVWSERGGP